MAQQLVTYIGAQGFFIAPLEAVARMSAEKGYSTTEAALKQRVSPFYASQEAAERALVVKQAEYDAAE